jgi:uncharacterized protein YcaQ
MQLTRNEAREYLTGQLGLRRSLKAGGARGARECLEKLRCIQLDPLDTIGTNADLVALARVDGLKRGDIYRHLFPGHAFEHFAKERCLLPASAFPYYRSQCAEAPWWRLKHRLERLPAGLVEAVLEEVRKRGPLTADALSDRGSVEPIDWSGWKGTSRAASMALEVLWTRCEVVVCGRERGTRVYDVPERVFPKAGRAPGDFARWALLSRVEAAGLLPRSGGPHWSMLAEVRTSALPDRLVEEGALVEVTIEGSSRRFLAPGNFRARRFPKYDGRMRVLGPLDPLLWDRGLVEQAFGFEYVWEVYKPKHLRKWGWYVCPLLHQGRLVGRIEAAVENGKLRVKKLWREKGVRFDRDAYHECLVRHAEACGAVPVLHSK